MGLFSLVGGFLAMTYPPELEISLIFSVLWAFGVLLIIFGWDMVFEDKC